MDSMYKSRQFASEGHFYGPCCFKNLSDVNHLKTHFALTTCLLLNRPATLLIRPVHLNNGEESVQALVTRHKNTLHEAVAIHSAAPTRKPGNHYFGNISIIIIKGREDDQRLIYRTRFEADFTKCF